LIVACDADQITEMRRGALAVSGEQLSGTFSLPIRRLR